MAEQATWPADARELVERTREIVALARRSVTALPDLGALCGHDLHAADAALETVRTTLAQQRIATAGDAPGSRDAALLLRAEHTHVAVKHAILTEQGREIAGARAAVHSLRGATSTATLIGRAAATGYRMGFSRVLFSRVLRGAWMPYSAFAGEDDAMAARLVAAGADSPRRLDGQVLESEMVRRGEPILVRNARSDPRVHAELLAVTKSHAYVAAPVYAWGRALGLIHADRYAHVGDVTEFDRDALGVFAEGLGLAFERNTMIERLESLRRAADDHLRMVDTVADDFSVEVLELSDSADGVTEPRMPASGSERPDVDRPDEQASRFGELTPREAEILHAIAQGRTNAQIAAALFVTEGTVKSHVKHILRKLSAANRTEAVAKFHRARRTGSLGAVV